MRGRNVEVNSYGVVLSTLRGRYHSLHCASIYDPSPRRDVQEWFYFSKRHRVDGPSVYYGVALEGSSKDHWDSWHIMGIDLTNIYKELL